VREAEQPVVEEQPAISIAAIPDTGADTQRNPLIEVGATEDLAPAMAGV